MNKLRIILCTWFYSGYLKPMPGTWGSLASLPLCLIVTSYWGLYGIILSSLALFLIGLWAIYFHEKETGQHDHPSIVIDEAVGMQLACIPLLYNFDIDIIILCFALFRLFDAIKKGPVGWLDHHINGALGVMIDDVAAGLLAAIVILAGLVWMGS